MQEILIDLVNWWKKWRETVSLGISLTTWLLAILFTPMHLGLFRMATYWVMTIQLSYFLLPLFLCKLDWCFVYHEWRHVARVCSILMFVIFWSIFIYDRELIFPAAADNVPGLNFLQHFLPPFLLLADQTVYIERPPRFLYPCVITSAYTALIFVWYCVDNTWPYIFMRSLNFGSFQFLVIIALFLSWVIHNVLCYPFYAPRF